MLADIAVASSSVHINQFGFRPGVIGDAFADALIAKAAEGVPVRLVVDRQGSDPERSSRALYERLTAAGIQICVVRATKPRAPSGPLGSDGATRWNLGGLGHIDHRKFVIVDGRVGWIGGAGIEDHFQDGRFHDLFVRVAGPVVAQLQLVFLAASAGSAVRFPPRSSRRSSPSSTRGRSRSGTSSCTTRPGATGRSRTRSRACSRARTRRSTSSTPTSPTAG